MPGQVGVSHGLLYLDARRIPTTGISPKGNLLHYACRSGMVTTFRSFRFEYGVVQIVARMPAVQGMWPALWLAASNKKPTPEVDIVEHWVRPVRPTGVFLHEVGSQRPWAYPATADLAKGWHTFSLIWTTHQMEWFIDGHRVFSATQGIPHQSMYFIADLASFRDPSRVRAGCGGSLVIKSVKIWQRSRRR